MSKKKQNKFSIPGIATLDEYLSNVVDLWIPTGLDPLNFIINPSGGGIPAGRITVIYGEESSGKSTLLAHIFKSCQQMDIDCLICDAENTFDATFASRVGMDPSKLGVLPVQSIEELDDEIRKMVKKFYAKRGPDTPFLIGIDSIEALDVEHYVTKRKRVVGDRARTWNPFWRGMATLQKMYRHFTVVALNQVRTNIQTSMFASGPADVAPGGRALGFYSSLRLRMKHRKTLTQDAKKNYRAYASVVSVKVDKSKVGKPFDDCLLYNRFAKGFDNNKSILYFLTQRGVLKKESGRTTVYSCSYFKYKGKKIKLKQAKAFLESYPWEKLKKEIEK